MKKERVLWLDALKGVAIIFVVLGHILLGYTENNAFVAYNADMKVLQQWIYVWHMPLFFMISGITFYMGCFNHSGILNKNKMKRNCTNLLFLYGIFDIVIIVLKVLFSNFVDNRINGMEILFNIFFPDTLMWYLWVLIIYYIIFSRVICLKNNKKVEIVLLGLALLIKMIDVRYGLRLCIKNVFYCAPFFYIGIILEKKWSISRSKNFIRDMYGTIIMIVLGTEVVLFSACYVSKEYVKIPVDLRVIIEWITAICICLLLINAFKRSAFYKKARFLSELGKASLVIYLVHTYIVTALKRITISIGMADPFGACLFILIITLITTYGIYWMSQRNKVLRYLFRPITLFENISFYKK